MKVVIAPDSFKGGLSAVEVAHAIASGWRSTRPDDEVLLVPLADGGEGTLATIDAAVEGARRCAVGSVTGPDGRPVAGEFLLLPDGTSVVEMATVSGLPLMLRPEPLGASSRGVGQVIEAALKAGATRILLGVGGSASTDGGAGALAALGARFLDEHGRSLPDGGGSLERLAAVDLGGLLPPPVGGMEILTDVDNPLLGWHGAATVFGPQKGALPNDILALERGLSRLAEQLGGDPAHPGCGAAGGVAYGFASVWKAVLRSGSESIADQVSLPSHLRDADVVITGEGRFDDTSLRGKVVGRVLALARRDRVPVAIVAGSVSETIETEDALHSILSLTELAGSIERSMGSPAEYLNQAGSIVATYFGRLPQG